MTIQVKHAFQSVLPDGSNGALVQPSNWNDDHQITIASGKLVGRLSPGDGPAEEIDTSQFVSSGSFATVATTGDYDDLTNKPALGTAAGENTTAFASAAQGALADTAVQPSDIGESVQAYSSVLAATTASFTTSDESKLDGIASGATANSSDAHLLNRSNHTGSQSISTITGLETALDGKATVAQGALADTAVQPGLLASLVTGPSSANGDSVALFDGTTGKLIKGSNTSITNTEVRYDRSGNQVNFVGRRVGTPGSGNIIRWVGSTQDLTPTQMEAVVMLFSAPVITAGALDGLFSFQTRRGGGSMTSRFHIGNGFYANGVTGGDKGDGTINATAVYDDNTLLTCMALADEFRERGEIDLDKWDGFAPDLDIPEQRDEVVIDEAVEIEAAELVEEDHGVVARIVRRTERRPVREWVPIYDEHGNGIHAELRDVTEVRVTPAQRVPRIHRTARLFKAMCDDGFDPRDPEQYFARLKADEALPGMPTRHEWAHGALSMGEIASRKWLAMEMLAIVAAVMWGKIKDHDARIAVLERA